MWRSALINSTVALYLQLLVSNAESDHHHQTFLLPQLQVAPAHWFRNDLDSSERWPWSAWGLHQRLPQNLLQRLRCLGGGRTRGPKETWLFQTVMFTPSTISSSWMFQRWWIYSSPEPSEILAFSSLLSFPLLSITIEVKFIRRDDFLHGLGLEPD